MAAYVLKIGELQSVKPKKPRYESVSTDGRVIGGRYVRFQMAEVAISRQVFAQILRGLDRLRAPPVRA